MQYPVDAILTINDEQELKVVTQFLDDLKTTLEGSALDLVNRIKFRMPGDKAYRVRIGYPNGGYFEWLGDKTQMAARFDTECAMHNSDVVLEEWRDGDYKPIRSRRIQNRSTR